MKELILLPVEVSESFAFDFVEAKLVPGWTENNHSLYSENLYLAKKTVCY